MKFVDEKISVIIPIFNDWMYIDNLLCIFGEMYKKNSFELILVDNGSAFIPDVSAYPEWVKVIICDQPGSYAARNYAISASTGNYLLFTDADCVPSIEWIDFFLNEFELWNSEFIFAGDIEVFPQNSSDIKFFEKYDILLGFPQKRYVARGYAVTANLFIPKKAFEEIGLFDSNRYSGGDAEFCRRALERGWKLKFLSNAIVKHPARKKWSELVAKQRRVVGGQIRNGKKSRRLFFVLFNFIPPLRQYYFSLKSSRLNILDRYLVCLIATALWIFGMFEVFRLFFGVQPERR